MRTLPLLLILVASASARAQIIYVDADAEGSNDGSNWTDAYTQLSVALRNVSAGNEIWVAEGIYKPTTGSDRTISFDLVSGVALYGGFNGTEVARDERDWVLHESILSGDVGVSGDSLDNSYHVISAVSVGPTTIVDGLVVRSGRADGAPSFDKGGGLYAPNSDITIRNSTFRWNGASLGAAIYFQNSSPMVEDSKFEENVGTGAIYASGGNPVLRRFTVTKHGGAGITFHDGSQALVEDCVTEYTSTGVLILDSSPTIRRCVFRFALHETGDGGGGGMDHSNPVFEDCLFESNWAESGAGVAIQGDSSPLFLRTTFRGNVASSSGGAVISALSAPVFIDSIFERNTGLGQGAILSLNSGITLINSIFRGNISSVTNGEAGGMGFTGNLGQGSPILVANTLFVGNEGNAGGALLASGVNPGEARIVNSAFVGNVARENGGAIYSFFADGLELNNVILWGNEAPNDPEIHVAEGGPPVVERAIVAGGYASGTDILDQDPLFVRNPDPGPDDQWGTDDDDYGDLRVLETSPAIDFGLTSFLPADIWDLDGDGNTTEPLPIDLNGDVRVQGGSVDLGAYEGPGIVIRQPGASPREFALDAAYPNPFNPQTTLAFSIAEASQVSLVVYDVLGRAIATLVDERLDAGRYETVFDGSRLSSGLYLVRMTASPENGAKARAFVQRITLLK